MGVKMLLEFQIAHESHTANVALKFDSLKNFILGSQTWSVKSKILLANYKNLRFQGLEVAECGTLAMLIVVTL